MLFANTCHKACLHVQRTRDYKSAARLMRAVGATLDETLMLLLGIHQRPFRRNPCGNQAMGAAPQAFRPLD